MTSNYQIEQIDRHTWKLADPFKTYLYLLEGTERALLIDAGNGFGGLKQAVRELTDKPVEVALTHGHFDHTGCSALFEKTYLTKEDDEICENGFHPEVRQEEWDFFCSLYHVSTGAAEKAFFLARTAPKKSEYIKEADILELGERRIEVIRTPGHTRGSVCYLDEGNGYLFSGDTVCNREVLIYFTHSATVETFRASVQKLLGMQEKYGQIWPGHHESPLGHEIMADYLTAAKRIMDNPSLGKRIEIQNGYKQLYDYKTIGISYIGENIYNHTTGKN